MVSTGSLPASFPGGRAFQKSDVFILHVQCEHLPVLQCLQVFIGQGENSAAPPVTKRRGRARGGIECRRNNGDTGRRRGRRCGGVRPMVPDFFEPRIQALPANGGKPVQGCGHVLQFGAGPVDDFQNGGVLGVEIGPVDDAFVMEHAVAEVADAFLAEVEVAQVALGTRGMGKSVAGDGVAEAGLGLAFVEETGPKTKVQFGHHAAGRDAFAIIP